MSARLNHRIDGPADAPVLVLAPSLGTSLAMWEPQLPALSQRFRVLRLDHRGHGASPAPTGPYTVEELGRDVLALLAELDVHRFGWAGLSLGGMVGMWLASEAPERVDRLALLCTSAHLPPAEFWLARAAAARGPGLSGLAGGIVARWFTPGFRARERQRVADFEAMLAATPVEGYAGCCEAIAAMDLRPRLSRITAKTLVIAGAEDPATPPAHGQLIAEGVAGSRLAMLANAAHLANVEQPEATTHLLLEHFGA